MLAIAENVQPRLPQTDGRFAVHFKPPVTRREAELLLETDAAMSGDNPGWLGYFVETMLEFLVFGTRPTGRISPMDAYWLAANLDIKEMQSAPALLRALVLQAEDVPDCIIELAMRCGAMRGPDTPLV